MNDNEDKITHLEAFFGVFFPPCNIGECTLMK